MRKERLSKNVRTYVPVDGLVMELAQEQLQLS